MSLQLIDKVFVGDEQLYNLANDALLLLKQLIAIPSVSGQEDKTADLVRAFMETRDMSTKRLHNNIWAFNKYYDPEKPTILLNSHHDTGKPHDGYARNPYLPENGDGKLYGLGSNCTGGCLVSLLAAFSYFYNNPNLCYNLLFAATAEGENKGDNGLKSLLPVIGPIDFAIVGEPTQMQLAIAEMGCMFLDCTARDMAGHTTGDEGKNASYNAMTDIHWFSSFHFSKRSGFMGAIKMTVTEINNGLKNNTAPSECHFTVDVRLNDCYTPGEVLAIIKNHTISDIFPRHGVMKPSCIDQTHPFVRAGVALGRKTYLSLTSSDQGWLDVPSLKMGPGDSARSHMANEYILIDEIKEGIAIYTNLLKSMVYCLIHNPEDIHS